MKEHYYSNFKGCLGTRTHLDSLDGSLASILAPPSIHVLSLSLPLPLSSFPRNPSVVRGCPSEPFKFRTRLLLSRCHFISTTWTKIHGRKYSPFELTQCPRYRQLFRIHTPPLSLSFSAPKFKFASRRSQKGVHLVRARNEGGGERSRRISGALVA